MIKKQRTSFMSIKKQVPLDRIHNKEFNIVARTLAQTSLDLVDFEKIKRIRNEDHITIVREYMLLKTGMFESWEILYH